MFIDSMIRGIGFGIGLIIVMVLLAVLVYGIEFLFRKEAL